MGYTQTYSLEGNPEEIYAGFGRKCGGFGASPEGVAAERTCLPAGRESAKVCGGV